LRPEQRARLNEILYRSERAMTSTAGLPRRDWFKHEIYAPGFYTGYGVKTMPSIREALEQRDWKEAEEQIAVVAGTLNALADEIDRAAKIY
jgi:N-acetylated-alpha-linked acidic dipeptidase